MIDRNAWRRKDYRLRKKMGICTKCPQNVIFGTLCPECAEKNKNWQKIRKRKRRLARLEKR